MAGRHHVMSGRIEPCTVLCFSSAVMQSVGLAPGRTKRHRAASLLLIKMNNRNFVAMSVDAPTQSVVDLPSPNCIRI